MKELSILVNSCDKYSEVWEPFFFLLFKYWTNDLPKVYLNTETLSYDSEKVITINSDIKQWSSRLIYCVEKINSPYILLLLDDFFIMHAVDTNSIFSILDILKSRQDIGGVYLKRISGHVSDNDDIFFDRFVIMKKNVQKYYLNFQAAIFKKEALLKLLIPGLSPWQIEEHGLYNSSNYVFLCDSLGSYTDCSSDIIPYLWALESGYGVCKSKWLWNNKKLFKKNGICFKRKRLGYYYHFVFIANRIKKSLMSITKKWFANKNHNK